MTSNEPHPLIIADDDPDDCAMTRDALEESPLARPVVILSDGEELMNYLRREGAYAPPHPAPRPALILLDLRMPRMDGFEVLRDIRAHPDLRRIPVVVMSSSRAPRDISRSYDLGVNSFITKPVTFPALVEAMKSLHTYWFQTVQLPRPQV